MPTNSIQSHTPCRTCRVAVYPERDGISTDGLCLDCWVDRYSAKQDVHDTTLLEALLFVCLATPVLFLLLLVTPTVGEWLRSLQ